MCLPFNHKWKTIKSENVKTYEANTLLPNRLPMRIDRVIELVCEKCGDVKVKKVKL